MDNSRETLIHQHFDELVQVYPGLALSEDFPGRWVVRGLLSFSATFNEVNIEDTFSVLIILPADYPNSPPTVQETGGRIPPDFHQYNNRNLCLGAPVEVYMRFRENPRLLPFVQTLLVEYLYGYSCLERYGKLPFDELSHGGKGIREHYQALFDANDVKVILSFLKILAESTYRGHIACVCGSGKIIRKCHGPILLKLVKSIPKEQFLSDAQSIFECLSREELEKLSWKMLPKKLKKDYMLLLQNIFRGRTIQNNWDYLIEIILIMQKNTMNTQYWMKTTV